MLVMHSQTPADTLTASPPTTVSSRLQQELPLGTAASRNLRGVRKDTVSLNLSSDHNILLRKPGMFPRKVGTGSLKVERTHSSSYIID